MPVEANKELMHRFVEIVTSGDADALDPIVAVDFIEHSPDSPSGPAGLKQFVKMIHKGFSDVQAAVEDVIAEDDKVGGRVIIKWHPCRRISRLRADGQSASFCKP